MITIQRISTNTKRIEYDCGRIDIHVIEATNLKNRDLISTSSCNDAALPNTLLGSIK